MEKTDQQGEWDSVDTVSWNVESDVQRLVEEKSHPSNTLTSYLNINSASNKIVRLREICFTAPVDILFIDERKIDPSFL